MEGFLILFSFLALTSKISSEKICRIVSHNDFVDYGNIMKYVGCTTVIGNVRIVGATFDGDPYSNYPGLHPSAFEVFSNIRRITGHLLVQGFHPDFKSLSYFRNLEVIEGQQLTQNVSLQVYYTTLESLDLSSLQQISNGNVLIAMNKNLCYADTINYADLLVGNRQRAIVKRNKPYSDCVHSRHVCHPRCDDDGCWGDGIDNCVGQVLDSNKIEDWIMETLQ